MSPTLDTDNILSDPLVLPVPFLILCPVLAVECVALKAGAIYCTSSNSQGKYVQMLEVPCNDFEMDV